MDAILNLLALALSQVWLTFSHNWPYLAASAVIAALLKVYVDQDKVAAFLRRYRRASVLAATAAAVGTPLCSCGTTAVVLGMMAGSMPWAPIVAFMASSPLTSPEGLFYSAGLFGWPFAVTFFVASIVVGLLGGFFAYALEAAGWLDGQARFQNAPAAAAQTPAPRTAIAPAPALQFALAASGPTACCSVEPEIVLAPAPAAGCACSAQAPAEPAQRTARTADRLRLVALETFEAGRRLLVYFLGFAFVGYLLNDMIPAAWVTTLFGQGNVYSVPLAATIGIPLYFNSEASLPLVRAMLDSGMSQGAALAFLVTGAGTSIGAVAGALTIARWRVVGLVVATLWIGAVATGFVFDALLALGVV